MTIVNISYIVSIYVVSLGIGTIPDTHTHTHTHTNPNPNPNLTTGSDVGSLVAAVLVTIIVMVVMAVGAFLVYFFVIKKNRENAPGKRGCIYIYIHT